MGGGDERHHPHKGQFITARVRFPPRSPAGGGVAYHGFSRHHTWERLPPSIWAAIRIDWNAVSTRSRMRPPANETRGAKIKGTHHYSLSVVADSIHIFMISLQIVRWWEELQARSSI